MLYLVLELIAVALTCVIAVLIVHAVNLLDDLL